MQGQLKFGKPKRMKLNNEDYVKQRKLLCERAGWRCESCGKILPLQRDHVVKRSHIGSDSSDNAQMLCSHCHHSKDNVAKSKSEYWNRNKG